MNFQSKTTHESKVCDGVAFTVRTVNQRKRAEWGLSIADSLAEQDRLLRQMKAIEDNGQVQDEKAVEYQELMFRWTGINNAHVKPALVDLALVSIDGITVDGEESNLAAILEVAPDELAEEIYRVCQEAAGLSGTDSKNLQLPGTSAGQMAGETSDSTVPSASA